LPDTCRVWSWVVVAVVILLGPRLLKVFALWQRQMNVRRAPLIWGAFSIADESSVPAGTRRGLENAAAELGRMGFVPVGYIQTAEYLPERPWFRAVLWHPTEKVFATAMFRPAARPIGLAIDFVTLFEDGAWIWTEQGRRHLFISDFTSGQLVDTIAADISERWELHRAAVLTEEGRRAREGTLADLCAFHSARDEEEIRLAVARGEVIPTSDPRRFHFTPGGARAFIRRFDDGERRVSAAGIGDPDLRNVPVEEQERHYLMAARIQELTRGRTWRIFGLSAVAFAASMLLWTSWSWIAWLVPVLLFHELGHWAAMRLFGHRDAWIAFIPFFGAATISGKRFDKVSHEIIVLLAGPVPGIVLGFALVFLSVLTRVHRPFFVQLAALLVGINVLNLLPLHPLDGGRIVHALVTAGRPRVSLVFKALAAVTFVAAAVGLRDATMAVLAAVSGYALWQEIKRTRIEGEIRRVPGFADSDTAEARRRFIFESLIGKPEGAPARWLTSVRLLEVPLSHTKPGRLTALIAGLAYVGLFGAAGFGVARLAGSTRREMHCPQPIGAIALSCDAPTLPANAWSNVPPAPPALLPRSTTDGATFGAAAFVWCDLADRAMARDLADRLYEAAHNAARYCTAFPWERSDDGAPETGHLRARSTLAELRRTTWESDDDELAAVDAVIARAKGRTDFDLEVARMYRSGVADSLQITETSRQALGDRLGRSSTRSCDRLSLANVVGPGRLSGTPIPPGPEPLAEPAASSGLRFSVRLGKVEDFAPLGRYLCELGCKVQVLPIAADDLRAQFCF
jgi:Zn-dependent protease